MAAAIVLFAYDMVTMPPRAIEWGKRTISRNTVTRLRLALPPLSGQHSPHDSSR